MHPDHFRMVMILVQAAGAAIALDMAIRCAQKFGLLDSLADWIG